MDKVLIVTGAGRGIGAAIAQRAARDGWAVAVNYLRDEDAAEGVALAIRAAGGRALAVRADVGDEQEVAAMFARVTRELGPVSALVNNAGITSRIGRFADADPAAIEAVFRINVFGTMHCCRAALAAFAAHGIAGVIVNVTSSAATLGSAGEYVHYAASKAAVDTFTVGLAREVAAQGIRVCGLAPGSTLTDIHASSGAPDRPSQVAPKIPLQRLAAPEEIAEPAVWLLSPAASYMTGTVVRCAGGL